MYVAGVSRRRYTHKKKLLEIATECNFCFFLRSSSRINCYMVNKIVIKVKIRFG